MKIKFLLFSILFSGLLSAQTFVEIGELNFENSQQTYSAAVKNKSVSGDNISIAKIKFNKGIGVHSKSIIKIKLNNSYRFTAKIGINDSKINLHLKTIKSIPLSDGKRIFYNITQNSKQFIGIEGKNGTIDKGSVIFKLINNGIEIYNSGIIRQGDIAKNIDLKLKRGLLKMVVEDAGDGASGDNAIWVNPKIYFSEIPPSIANPDYFGEQPKLSKKSVSKLKSLIKLLPEIKMPLPQPKQDWLINNKFVKAKVYRSSNNKNIIISNGLIARVFSIIPNLATIDYINQMTGESILRSVSNEGVLTIDGKTYLIGGLSEQPEYGYTLMKWVDQLSSANNSFMIKDFKIKKITDRMQWKRTRWSSNKKMPTGKEIIFTLSKNNILVKVHYALYDGIPTLCKWIEVINNGDILIQLNKFKLEQLALIEGESLVDVPKYWVKPNIHFETDFAFSAMQQKTSDKTTFWEPDPRYTSQTNYRMQLPCLLEIKPPLGPETAIKVGESLTTFRVWETPLDTREEERQGLFIRKMYRTISPWTTENPIFMHLTTTDPKIVKSAIDQCAEVGYEMIILSFGSGVNMENEKEQYYKIFKEYTNYANSKGIELGSYSLLASRWISEEVDVINPKTGKRGGMTFGSSPCICSNWGYNYMRKIKKFFVKTGFSVFEHDGSYPGDVCASTHHAHHNNLGDSQWKQFAQIKKLYNWMRSEGIYLNVPDFYINTGSNKMGIGYREVNWSLPRERQLVLGRMNIYDGLWTRIPSMCWTFVPLTQYHGGGAAATMEPLNEHLHDYENHMMQNYGSGVQACYRGPRLYDTEETKKLVVKVINWYKKYRYILNSDLIHLKRASAKDWDGFMHANPNLKEKGLAMLFNPTNKNIERKITLPLYYTGLDKTANVRIKEGKSKRYTLSRDYSIVVNVKIPANSFTWLVIE